MSYCGNAPGHCGKRADCADHYCPGRNEALFAGGEQHDEPIYAMDGIETVIWMVIAISLLAIVVGVARAVACLLPI